MTVPDVLQSSQKNLGYKYEKNKPVYMQGMGNLKLLHGGDVGRLDVVFELLDLVLEVIQRDLLVLDDDGDLFKRGRCHASANKKGHVVKQTKSTNL